MPDPFIDRIDLSDMLGRDVSADPGALIAVDAACDLCRRLGEQQFNRGTTTITLDGSGTDALMLPERPVNSAGTVTVAGGTVTDYAVDTRKGLLLRKVAPDYDWPAGLVATSVKWPRGRQNVTVTYDHGWSPDDIPRDIRMVALSIAERLVIQGPALQETVGDTSIRYAVAQLELMSTEKLVLESYRSY